MDAACFWDEICADRTPALGPLIKIQFECHIFDDATRSIHDNRSTSTYIHYYPIAIHCFYIDTLCFTFTFSKIQLQNKHFCHFYQIYKLKEN